MKQKVSKGRRGSVTKRSGEYSTLGLASGTRDHPLGSEIPSSAISTVSSWSEMVTITFGPSSAFFLP